MKKKIMVCMVLLIVAMSFANAEYWSGYGFCDAIYIGSTEDWTIDKLYNHYFDVFYHKKFTRDIKTIGKLSKKQEKMLRRALNEYDYEPGEFYFVCITDERDMESPTLGLVVQINADKSISWMGFAQYFYS